MDMDGHHTPAESQMLTITTSPPTPYSPTPTISTITVLFTITLMNTDVVPYPTSPQPISGDMEPTHESPSTTAAIIGGIVVAAMLLALLLIFIAVRFRRSKQKFTVTPFNLRSTAEPSRVEPPQVWIELQRTDNFGVGVRPPPSSRGPSTVQLEHPDPCLAQDGSPCAPSGVRVDPIPSPPLQLLNDPDGNDNDTSASTVARRQRSHELEKLYPSPSRIRAQRHRHRGLGLSGDNRVEHMVMGASDDRSREPSEELPAYTCPLEPLRSRDADRDVSS